MDRRLWLLVLLAAVMRAIGCVVHAVPGRDGVSYLWMAEQWAAGHEGELFRQVFHPLYPLLVGLVLQSSPSLDTVLAGQVVAGGCSALAVIPLVMATARLFGGAAASWAGVMFAIGAWFVRHPAECMSEGPFQLLVLGWAASLTAERVRAGLGGFCAGAAFLARPEGAALALAGLFWHAKRSGWRAATAHVTVAVVIALLLPIGSLFAGEGFVLTPKAAFNWDVGVGGAAHGVGFYLRELAKLPGDAWEGLGYLVLPLAVLGVWRQRPRPGSLEFVLLLPFLLQCAVIPLLRSNLRFVSGLGVLLLPFAGAGLLWLLARWRHSSLLVLLLVASEAKLWLGRPADRTIERELGRWIGGQLSAGETLCSDMPRLWFFAGRQPPPPRVIGLAELRLWAESVECRYTALRRGRSDAFVGELQELGFVSVELPEALRERPGAADVLLWQRTR